MTLRDRFTAAGGAEPLSDLSPHARDELAAILQRAAELEDLPGKWQAALLRAEAGAPAPNSCCGHAHSASR